MLLSKRYIIGIILSMCLLSTICQAKVTDSRYVFRLLDSKVGVSDNNIRNLLMLPNGMMVLYSPTMLSLYDGINYSDYSFNSIFIPYKEFSTNVDLVYTPDEKIVILNGDRTWLFDLNRLEFIYQDDNFCKMPLSSIKAIELDNQDNYFIYSKDERLFRYNRESRELTMIDTPKAVSGNVKLKRHENYIYILTRDGALLRYDTLLNSFTHSITDLTQGSTNEIIRSDIDINSKGDIWIMYDRTIQCIDGDKFTQSANYPIPQGHVGIYTCIGMDSKDRLWVGGNMTDIILIDTRSGEVERPYVEVIEDNHIDSRVRVSNLYVDRKGGVWLATEINGVLYHHEDMFRLVTVNNTIGNDDMKCLVADGKGNILFGTTHGLYKYNTTSGVITLPYPSLSGVDCVSLYTDSRDRVWLGTFRDGLFCIDGDNIRNYFYAQMPSIEDSYQVLTPNYNCVRSFYEDSKGGYWISVYGGLARFDEQSGDIELISEHIPKLSHHMFVRDITQVGNSIFASSNDGCFNYDINSGELNIHPFKSDFYNKCNMAVEDAFGAVWIATSTGLRVVREVNNDKSVQTVTTKDGLLNNNVIAVVEDNLSNIWAIGPSSVSRIRVINRGDKENDYKLSISSFTIHDGLSSGITIYPKSVTVDKRGRIYVGGSRGATIIDPSQLYQRSDTAPPIITNLYVNNRLIVVGEEYNDRVILDKVVSSMDEIVLNHNESFISFDFSNLNYVNPNHTIYRYKLENFDQDWTQTNSKDIGRITYTLLRPGNYIFKVNATNNGTDWGNQGAELKVVIRPPFYKTTLAYTIYSIISILSLIYLIIVIKRRNMARMKQHEQAEREQINQIKFRFFTNISHELRTPLSLILLPLSNIIRKTSAQSEIMPQLLLMERNASSLLSLVNHLLDFRKLEMGGEKLTLSKSNPAELIDSIISDFSQSALQKGITLKMVDMLDKRIWCFDSIHMNKVFNNLISNALKFTPQNGDVIITLKDNDDGNLIVEVCDNGVGISEADQKRIFERFYQAKDQESHAVGSGIGLHIVKLYIELHNGTLGVESKLGVGSTFRVTLPPLEVDNKTKESATADDEQIDECCDEHYSEDDSLEDSETCDSSERVKILLVEDNSDFREYLAMELKGLGYDVYTAIDGEDGIERARSVYPSIIVCDIMMPKCDGFTLCNTIKEDINTSHIPIILLTARTAEDVRYEGYKAGADAFISKPFSFDILEIRIQKLIEERQRRLESIKSPYQINSSQITITPLDEKLMAQIMSHIDSNMSNAEYSIEQLSRDVAMHRMNLYRKIQSIAGMTPSEFLRTVRIKRAAELLQQSEGLSIVEVSEMVGFNTPRYFTNYFKQIYGVTPSQYVVNLKNGEDKE